MVDAEQARGLQHVFAPCPERGRRAVPVVAAVKEQGARSTRPQALHQRREVREAARLAVDARGALEIQMAEGVRLRARRRDAEAPQQGLADQVRRAARGRSNAEVRVGLAEIVRQQLRMAVGEMQQVDVAEAGYVVEL